MAFLSASLIAAAHREPVKVAFFHESASRYPLDPQALYGTSYVLRTGQLEIRPNFFASTAPLSDQDQTFRQLVTALGAGQP